MKCSMRQSHICYSVIITYYIILLYGPLLHLITFSILRLSLHYYYTLLDWYYDVLLQNHYYVL